MRRRHALGGGGGGHHHHHHGGGGGPWFGYPYAGYGYPETNIYVTDCVRDPLDLRRCLPPQTMMGDIGGAGSLLALGVAALVVLTLAGRKKR